MVVIVQLQHMGVALVEVMVEAPDKLAVNSYMYYQQIEVGMHIVVA